MTPSEQRRARERESIFSALYDLVNQQNAQLASEGRRPVLGGLLSKEPVEGVDTIRYEGIGNMLAGLLAPAAKAFDAPMAAAQGNIPREDMLSEALGTAGMAMLGGGAVAKPSGSLGMNVLRDTPNEMRSNQVLVRIPVRDVQHGESAMTGGKLTWPDAPKLIEEYAKKETDLPPIEIMANEGGTAMIADGSHRFEAAKLRGQDYVEAYVNKSDLPDLPSAEVMANASKSGGIFGSLLGRAPTFEEAPMVVQHNISPEGLAISNQIGGIPMPSIGIAGAKAPIENFGEVTLMLNPEKIAPRRDLPVYPADAYTGRQPRAFMDFVDEDQVRKNFRADPRFEHIGSSWLDSYSLDDADYMMKIVERGIDEKLIDPKNFDDFRKMYREAQAKLGADAYDAEVMSNTKGLSQYGDMQLSIAPEDWYTPSGNRRSPKPYTVEEAYKRMNKKKAYEAGAEQHSGAGLLRAVLLDKFKNLDDIKANRGLLRPSGNEMQDIKGSWDTMSYDAINDIAEKYFDGSHRKAEDYVTDVAMGKSVSWANAPDGARKATEKTLAKLKKEVKGMPTEYFEAKPRSVAQIGDFDAAVVPAGRQSVIDMLKAAGIKDIREYDDAVTGQTRRDIIGGMEDYFFSNASPLGGLLSQNMLSKNEEDYLRQKGLLR